MQKSLTVRGLNLGKLYWYVVSNRAGAVLYSSGKDGKLHFVERFKNPKGERLEQELVSDAPGVGFSSAAGGTVHHRFEQHLDKHERIATRFAQFIAEKLRKSLDAKQFDDLILVAEPHFLGLLRSKLDRPTRERVIHEIHHEYTDMSDADLQQHIAHALEADKVRLEFV